MLLNLPEEVWQLIARNMDQQEAIKMAQTSKRMHRLMIPRIYEHVVVDSTPKNFSNVVIPHNINGHSTVIRSIYSLKKFLNLLVNKPYYCSLIRTLETAKNTPDISDNDLNYFFKSIIPKLVHLKLLIWISDSSRIDSQQLANLPSSSTLETLWGNFLYSECQGFICSPQVNMNCMPELACCCPTQHHQSQLLKLNVSTTLKNLTLLNIPRPQLLKDLHLDEYPLLQKLVLSMKRLSTETPGNDYIKALFPRRNDRVINLKSLELVNFVLKPSNASDLKANLNLDALEELAITNSHEEWFATTRGIVRRSPPIETFFELLTPHLVNLKSLKIGTDNDLHCNNILISSLNKLPSKLTYLAVEFKFGYRNLIVSGSENIEFLHPILVNFADAVLKFGESLKELKVDVNLADSTSNGNLPDCISSRNLPQDLFNKICNLEKLEILTLPIHESALNNVCKLLNFKQLKYLDVIVKTSVKTVQRTCLVNSSYFKYPTATMCTGCPFGETFISPNSQYVQYSTNLSTLMPLLQFVLFAGLLFFCGSDKVELWENISIKTLRSWISLMRC